jgi:exosortase
MDFSQSLDSLQGTSTAAVAPPPLPHQAQRAMTSRAIAAAVCVAAAYVPIVWSYVAAVIELPHYSFVLLLPLGAAVLAWPRFRKLGVVRPGDRIGFALWLTPAILGLLVAIVLESPWFGVISALFALMAVVYAIGGTRFALAMLPAWVVLWMGVRLPLTMDESLAQKLQNIAAYRASIVLDAMGEKHLLDGNVVETPMTSEDGGTKRYMVEEACSGIQSLFAVTACTIFFALWMRETWWRALLLLSFAWWWVWAANVGRVILITYLNSNYGWKVDEGLPHTILGATLFAVTLGLIVSTEHLLLFVIPRGLGKKGQKVERDPNDIPDFGPTVWPSATAMPLSSFTLAGLFLGLVVLQWLPQMREPEASATPVNLDDTLDEKFAPKQIAGWQLVDGGYKSEQRREDSQWGARSQSWKYRKGTQEMVVSVDYPFRGWHELTICYEADGWFRQGRDVVGLAAVPALEGVAKPDEKCVRALFHRPDVSAYGYLLFESLNDRRQPIPVPVGGREVVQKLRDRLTAFVERVKTLGASGSGLNDQTQSFQLQVFMQGYAPSTDEERNEAALIFAEFRGLLARSLPTEDAS